MLLILNQKVCRCLQCWRLSLDFQITLCFCGGVGYPVAMVSKLDLFQLANVFFLRFFWIFLLFLVLQSEYQLKILLAHLQNLVLSSNILHLFYKYSLSKSVLLFCLTSKFFITWFKVPEKVLSLLSIIEISQLTRHLGADSCASIFQISCSFTVPVGTFWMDCIDGVCIFCSIGIAGWLKF